MHGGTLTNLGSLYRITTQDARQDETCACCRIGTCAPRNSSISKKLPWLHLLDSHCCLAPASASMGFRGDDKHVSSRRGLLMRLSTS